MKNKQDTKALIEVKNDIFSRIRNWFKKLISVKCEESKVDVFNNKDNEKEILLNTSENIENSNNTENIEVTNQSINKIILNAKNAYENYVLSDEYELSENLYNLIKERINVNRDNIEKIISINNSSITFSKIIEILENEELNLQNYKKTIESKKIDDKFMFSKYLVPVRNYRYCK